MKRKKISLRDVIFPVFRIFSLGFLLCAMLFPFAGVRAETNLTALADFIEIYKSDRVMILKSNGDVLRRYSVAIGQGGLAPKQRRGDMLTPEGLYYIDARNPQSAFHLSLKISYPNAQDVARAQQGGYDPGDFIMIHGQPNDSGWWRRIKNRFSDWTLGCIAVTNTEMEEIWRLVPLGTPIIIYP